MHHALHTKFEEMQPSIKTPAAATAAAQPIPKLKIPPIHPATATAAAPASQNKSSFLQSSKQS
jgi:hypothetical protein